MSLRRDLIKHVKALTIDQPSKPHIIFLNLDMIKFEDALQVQKAMENIGINGMLVLVKGDVRQAASVVAFIENGEIKEVTDQEEATKNA